MIRTVFLVLCILFFATFSIVALPIIWLIGKFNMKLRDKMAYGLMHFAFSVAIFISGMKLTVKGKENIPTDVPVLYVGNHRSAVDIVVCYRHVLGCTGFISKKEWEKIPFLNYWIKTLHGLFLDRDNIKEGLKVILEAIDRVKVQGYSICIFPEGTRSHTAEMLPFKEGSMKIATKSGCPIIPMALVGTDDIFENNNKILKPGKVTLRFGEPIYPDKLDKEEVRFLGAKTREIIQTMIDEEKKINAEQ